MSKATKSKKIQEAIESDPGQVLSEPVALYQTANMVRSSRAMTIMGLAGKKEFGAIENEADFITVIREGIPKHAMTHLMDIADISLSEMAAIVHASDRTLRRYKPQQKLPQEQSERMIELARLYGKGEEVLGSIQEFKIWMDTFLLPLGNKKPKEYLDTSIGINILMNELGRIQHGVFA